MLAVELQRHHTFHLAVAFGALFNLFELWLHGAHGFDLVHLLNYQRPHCQAYQNGKDNNG